MKRYILLLLLSSFVLAGCVTNPVTGKKELSLVSEKQELAIGAKQYSPARQSQGGDYVVDAKLTAYVNQVGQRLAAVSDRKLPYEFKVLNNSVPNAWALPGGKISINRGLLTELKSESELAAVLGHEIVHAAAKHGVQRISTGMLLQGAVIGTVLATQGKSYANMAQIAGNVGTKLITMRYSRDAERESDYYGMQYMVRAGYDPQGAVDLQQTFLKLSKGKKRQDWISGLFATHPPSQERVQNNMNLLASLPKGGEIGKQRYQQEIARLMRTKPAYDAYDKASKAMANGNVSAAKKLVQKAISLEPKEAHFYALLGDVEQENNRLQAAVKQYDKAVRLNPGFFYHYLKRGKVNEKLKRMNQARSDLERSVKLLPTADAYHSLGDLARKEGRLDQAKAYYVKAIGGKGQAGQHAYSALVEMDLKNNPNAYVKITMGMDRRGRIVAQVSNPTPRNIGGLIVAVQFKNEMGQLRQLRRSLRGTVAAGSKRVFDLGMDGIVPQDMIESLRVMVVSAQVLR